MNSDSDKPIDRLRSIVARLRAPDGCPWDREQTHSSLIPGLIEEVYEVIDAIHRQHDADLREELGDLLLQVVMHAQMAGETGRFTFDDVSTDISDKMVRRHPHVFGENRDAKDTAAVLKQWDEIKRTEKNGDDPVTVPSLLDGVPLSFPALLRAKKLQAKAAKIGFDWPEATSVLEKVVEETSEVRAALTAGEAAKIEEEIGDLLFTVVNLARKCDLDPELTLQRASDKFSARFRAMERTGKDLKSLTPDQLETLWANTKIG
ncbi:MAG TPA: nucleoside triphosphate pyrophosphohydrolase [Chthoniobacterales bacterium]